MKSKYRLTSFAIGGLSIFGAAALSQQPAGPPSALPVKQVTLFTSGVAYTERGGQVDGNAEVPLTFRTAQINDILKSLVLLDQGGKVQPATYASRDPVSRSLQAFAVDVSGNLTVSDLLGKLRGSRIAISEAGKPTVTGQIVGIEQREIPGGSRDSKPSSASFVNLLTEAGLVTVKLDTDKTIKVLDLRLDQEFRDALTLLASGADDQRRQVKLHFAGAGKRDVRVGYVMEAPIWKISYRLVMGGDGAGKPYLQGWALVENATDEDWTGVKLSLVSGRPVSFIQDLYQPLYIPRPIVGPDIVASPYPQTHGDNLLAEKAPQVASGSVLAGGANAADALTPSFGGASGGRGGGMGGGMGGMDGAISGHTPIARRPTSGTDFGLESAKSLGFSSEALRQSVEAAATGDRAGELFQYSIATPINLHRQESAMIPVIAQDVETEKLSLFNVNSGSRFPLNAVRLKNTTGLHLKGGSVTLFDGGVYAGDARMEDVPPLDSRLITYAVDLETEVAVTGVNHPSTETTISIQKGVLVVTSKQEYESVYTVKSKAEKSKQVLIEHPLMANFTLMAPAKPTEQTSNLYRFAVTVQPGKSETLKVVTEQPIEQRFAMLDTDYDTLAVYSNRKQLPEKLKAAIQEVIQRRRHVLDLRNQGQAKDNEISSISADQDRIRKNMDALDKNSNLYKRYVGELDAQETHLDQLRTDSARLKTQADALDKELKSFVTGINL